MRQGAPERVAHRLVVVDNEDRHPANGGLSGRPAEVLRQNLDAAPRGGGHRSEVAGVGSTEPGYPDAVAAGAVASAAPCGATGPGSNRV